MDNIYTFPWMLHCVDKNGKMNMNFCFRTKERATEVYDYLCSHYDERVEVEDDTGSICFMQTENYHFVIANVELSRKALIAQKEDMQKLEEAFPYAYDSIKTGFIS